MATRKRQYSAAEKERFGAERAAKAEAAKGLLTAGLAALQSSEDWRTMLAGIAKSARVRFSPRRLSFVNQLLLLQQGSHGPVATFEAWKRAGRHVKKGEKGKFIRQPRPFSRERANAETGETETDRGLFFRFIPVFDLAQTEGEELVEVKLCGDVAGDQVLPFAVETLRTVALAIEGEPVKAIAVRPWMPEDGRDALGAHGWYAPRTKEIVIVESDNEPAKFKTLCHEVAHALLHGAAAHHEYAANEVEAESVAFIVASVLGFDTAAYSFPYVATWASRTNDARDAAKLVLASGERILRAANVILDALFAAEERAEAEEVAA